ncbi:DUF998 domain-containing protein [Ktedonobacter racemifer]|uniref:DUF998 domain-containing protein n=1 Tax=Ktedonobacter racemifer DSM 44963 TaxID=485913 RepID=D6U2E3_KTERA|nr:DUF998 domain-containing protein [Ktedonobacter racemifer]EFH82811.1 conserved hypothetical protein [Ktedonobacter racemifer DSM 44963]
MQNTSYDSRQLKYSWANRWLALAGVVGPILAVIVSTLAGFLRSGYSPASQAISALGVGANAWIVKATAIAFGALQIAFAFGFFLGMRQIIKRGWRIACLALLSITGIGTLSAGIFPSAPETVTLHWLLGDILPDISSVALYIIAGCVWLRVRDWRGYGWYSLLTVVGTVAFNLLLFVFLAPRSPLASAQIGGVLERIAVITSWAWYVVIGWRLFVWMGSSRRVVSRVGTVGQGERK